MEEENQPETETLNNRSQSFEKKNRPTKQTFLKIKQKLMTNRNNKSPEDLEVQFKGRRRKHHAKTYGDQYQDKTIFIHSKLSTPYSIDLIDQKIFLSTKQKIDYLCREQKNSLIENNAFDNLKYIRQLCRKPQQ